MGPGEQAGTRTDKGSRGTNHGKSSASGNEAGHNIGSLAGPAGAMGTQGGTSTKSAAANRDARGAFDVTAKAPARNDLPPNVTPTVPAGKPVGDYSPYYHWTDWDRVQQAAMLAGDIATGSIFGFLGSLVKSELPGKLTPPRGYTKTGVRTGATRSSDANSLKSEAAYPFPSSFFANLVPISIDGDQYFAFYNPGN